MKTFTIWMRQATTAQQQELAAAVGTSRPYLYQIKQGVRTASADLGSAIERQTAAMAEGTGLPVVLRSDLVPACAACEYMASCTAKTSG